MVWNFIIQLAAAVVLAVLSFALAPRPKPQQPDATKDLEAPTAEAGRPIPVVHGTIVVKSANCLGYGRKDRRTYNVRA